MSTVCLTRRVDVTAWRMFARSSRQNVLTSCLYTPTLSKSQTVRTFNRSTVQPLRCCTVALYLRLTVAPFYRCAVQSSSRSNAWAVKPHDMRTSYETTNHNYLRLQRWNLQINDRHTSCGLLLAKRRNRVDRRRSESERHYDVEARRISVYARR